jgi:hypothetical protein
VRVRDRDNGRDIQEWTIQKHWQHWVHTTQNEEKQKKKYNTENWKRGATRTPPTSII